MIPDIFQYFLEHFWNFPQIGKMSTFSFFFVEIFQAIQEAYGSIFETYLLYLDLSKIQNSQMIEAIGHNKMKFIFSFLSRSGGPETIVFSHGVPA